MSNKNNNNASNYNPFASFTQEEVTRPKSWKGTDLEWNVAKAIGTCENGKVHLEKITEDTRTFAKKAIKEGANIGNIESALKLGGWTKQQICTLFQSFGIARRAKDKPTGKRAVVSAKREEQAKTVLDFAKGLNKADFKAILYRAYTIAK